MSEEVSSCFMYTSSPRVYTHLNFNKYSLSKIYINYHRYINSTTVSYCVLCTVAERSVAEN